MMTSYVKYHVFPNEDSLCWGTRVRKLAACVIASMLVVSMVVIVVPIADADESYLTETSQAVDASEQTSGLDAGIDSTEDVSSQSGEGPFMSEQDLGTTQSGATDDGAALEDPDTSATTGETDNVATNAATNAIIDHNPGVEDEMSPELAAALEELYRLVMSVTGPSIVRVDGGYLTEKNPTATFRAGDNYGAILDQVNRICALLPRTTENRTLVTPTVSSLLISVVGELPEGFSFSENTLTLTDMGLLSWDAVLGDGPDSITRLYQIKLQLTTGVSFIDDWLARRGVKSLGNATFSIELLLSGLPDPAPIDLPTSSDPTPPSSNAASSMAFQNNGMDPGANAADAALAPTGDGEQDLAVTEEEDPLAETGGTDLEEIEERQIPMASMMVDSEGNVIVVNTALAGFSLIMSAAYLVYLRQMLNPSSPKVQGSSAQASRLALALGSVSIGLGAVNAVLLLLSQYAFNSSDPGFSWTPVLVAIGSIQLVCMLGLFVYRKLTACKSKKQPNQRHNIRY